MATPVTIKRSKDDIEYPTGDGEPMAETALHRNVMVYVIESLKTRFAGSNDHWISGDDFVYFIEGDPNRRVSPDAYIVFDVGNEMRDCYKTWEEGGKMPDVVFEITSKSTKREDTVTKMHLYEQTLKVSEYFLFDPTGDYLNPILQGYRLINDRYERLELRNDRLISNQLGLELVLETGTLRFVDPLSQWRYLTPGEEHDRADAERNRADAERNRADREGAARQHAEDRANQAEQELAKLRALLEAQREREP